MDSRDVDQVQRWLEQSRGRWFDIVFAGRVFGGKPGEASQSPERLTILDDSFRLHFGGELLVTTPDAVRHVVRESRAERLEIIQPEAVSTRPDGSLVIAKAMEARFGWFYYGRPAAPENWSIVIYKQLGRDVEFTVTGPARDLFRGNLPERFALANEPLVLLSPFRPGGVPAAQP